MIWQIIAIGMMWISSVVIASYYAYNSGYASALSWATKIASDLAKQIKDSKNG